MVPIKERLSLDWLKDARAQRKGLPVPESQSFSAPASMPPDIESALLAYGGEILSALRKRPNKEGRLHDLVKELGFRLQDTLPVVDYLITQGFLRKVEDDPVANHLLALTAKGEKPAG